MLRNVLYTLKGLCLRHDVAICSIGSNFVFASFSLTHSHHSPTHPPHHSPPALPNAASERARNAIRSSPNQQGNAPRGGARVGGVAALRELEGALIEARLRGDAFLAGNRPTLADIASFPHAMLAPDGGISTDPYPTIRLWTRSLRALPRFIEMPGIHRLHELKPEPTGSQA